MIDVDEELGLHSTWVRVDLGAIKNNVRNLLSVPRPR